MTEPRPLSAYPKPPKRGPKNPKRLRKQRKTPRAKLVREADALWAGIVKRAGVCDFSSEGLFPDLYPHECSGSLQAMHGISRRYHGTRWNMLNGFCGCARVHMYFTHRPQEWDDFLIDAWGYPVWKQLWELAWETKPDMEAVLAKLREEEGRR